MSDKEFRSRNLYHLDYDDHDNLMFVPKGIEIHKKASEMIDKVLFQTEQRYLAYLAECESPIEQILSVALMNEESHNNYIFSGYVFQIIPQSEIDRYRVDFEISVEKMHQDYSVTNIISLVVECDGHEFHEKTKEQAKKDKSRDRYLQSKGYFVLRFTGSEIWNDPQKCAREVFDMLIQKVREYRLTT